MADNVAIAPREPIEEPGCKGLVYVVDDDDAMRGSIARAVAGEGYRVATVPSPDELLSTTIDRYPAAILLDMRMPKLSGLQLQERLLASGNGVPIVFISGESTVREAVAALGNGAVEFLLKPFGTDMLLGAVERAIARDLENMRRLLDAAQASAALSALAARERQVFELLCHGHGNAEIVQRLGISLHTAKQYKTQIMRKLGVSTLAEVIALGARRGPRP